MTRKFLTTVSVLLLLLTSSAIVAVAETELTRISDAVYAYVGVPEGTAGNAFSANAGVIIGDDGAVVVDTLTSAKEGELFLQAIRKVTDKPILYVVNTHYHLDHAMGNCVFKNLGARIISHTKCRQSILDTGEQTLQDPGMFGLDPAFWEGTTIAAPTLTFERELDIDLGNLSVKIIHSGFASHSPGSIMVHIPDQGVLFTGDILFTDFHPFLAEGNFPGWNKTLDLITSMNVTKIIPGHGPLSTNKDVLAMKTYLQLFDENAKKLCAIHNNAETVKEEMVKVLPRRNGGEFIIPMNLTMRYIQPPENSKKKY